jgi:enoyl-CoA hydratase
MTDTTRPLIEYQTPAPNVARLMLNRPEVANAQNPQLLKELDDAFSRALGDDEIHVIILGGHGKHFSSGHDLTVSREEMVAFWQSYAPRGEWGTQRSDGAEKLWAVEKEIFLHFTRRWRNLGKPTIAAVQGACMGGGLMLAWACDLIVAAENARFSDPVVEYGMMGVEWFVHPWELGARKAKEHLFMAKEWTAADAEKWGMVNHVVPVDQLHDFALGMAEVIAEKPGFAVRLAKETVNRCVDIGGQAQALEAAFYVHQLNHQNNMVKFGTPMDRSRVKFGKPEKIKAESWAR